MRPLHRPPRGERHSSILPSAASDADALAVCTIRAAMYPPIGHVLGQRKPFPPHWGDPPPPQDREHVPKRFGESVILLSLKSRLAAWSWFGRISQLSLVHCRPKASLFACCRLACEYLVDPFLQILFNQVGGGLRWALACPLTASERGVARDVIPAFQDWAFAMWQSGYGFGFASHGSWIEANLASDSRFGPGLFACARPSL
eukprot:1292610-Amphidinium_carterae.1